MAKEQDRIPDSGLEYNIYHHSKGTSFFCFDEKNFI